MTCFRLLVPALLVATSSPLAQSTPQQDKPVFRSGVDLVRVDIRVTDDDGRPIANLRPDEVRIKEEGAVRPVVLFQHIAAPTGTYAEAAQRAIAGQVSTNQGSPRGHVYVLVFDENHIRSGHEQRARAAAERFLRTRARPGDRVALYALPGPGPQIEFTADVPRVLRALAAVRGSAEETGSAAAIGPAGAMRIHEAYEITRGHQEVLERQVALATGASDARTACSNRQSRKPDQEDDRAGFQRAVIEDARALVGRADGDTRRFLGALADVIRTLRAVDGRKAVILFSEGFQTDNLTHELDDVAAAAAESYSVVYAMDLNARNIDAGEETPNGGQRMTEIRDRLQSLGILTGETGGTLVTDASAQLDRALARIAETTEDYYLVGFLPANQDQRRSYRHIQVDVTRPGAHVEARTGYMPNSSLTPADRRRTIDAALRAPFSKQDLRVEYTTYTLRGSAPDVQRVIVSLAAELPVAAADEEAADVVYVLRDVQTGKVAASASERIFLPAAKNTGAITGTGFHRVQFELPAGTYLMRAVVREPGGLVGSADRRFQVHALNGPDVSASDLVVGSSESTGLPVQAVAYASEVLTGVFELYGRTEAQLDALTVVVDLVPVQGGPPALSSHAELQSIKSMSAAVSRPARVEFPLSGIAPGEYLMRATVRDKRDTVTELLRDVTVRAGTRPAPAPAAAASTRFDPLAVLHGTVVQHLVEAIETRVKGSALAAAAHAASGRNWSAVVTMLPSPSSAPEDSALRGLAAFARADYGAAIAALRDAQRDGAHDAALAFVLGWAHSAAGDDPAAVTAWRNAIVGDAAHVPSYLALIDTYARLGHPELALQVVHSGLRTLPDSPELLDRLARLERR